MNLRRTTALLTLPVALVLAGCTGSSGGSSGGSAAGSSPAGPASASGNSAADALAARLTAAAAKITSAHFTLHAVAAGETVDGTGSESLRSGRLEALQAAGAVPGLGAVALVVAGGQTYAKLPASLNTTGKPYVLVSAQSNDPIIKQVALLLEPALVMASIGSVGPFVAAGDSVTAKGKATVGGVSTTRYAVVVDVAKLETTLPGSDALAGGQATIPVQLYVDSQDRPVEMSASFKVSGQPLSARIIFNQYGQPVSITAPPSSEVGG